MILLLTLACTDKDALQDSTLDLDLDLLTSEDRPTKRGEIYGIADEASNTLLVFGGNDGPIVDQTPKATYLDETWVFEPGTGWTELDIEGPSARGRYGQGYDGEKHRAILFGGRWRKDGGSGDYDLYNDLWAFDFGTRTWEELDDGSDGPPPRYYGATFWDAENEAFYLYGGATNADPMAIKVADDFWKWTEDDGWKEFQTSGDAPSQRTFLAETFDAKRRRLVIFGGQVGDYWSNAYNETYVLDLDGREWTELNDGDDAPSTRMHGQLLYDQARDRYILFGGHTDIGDGNDLWELDPESGEWSELRMADEFTGNGLGCGGNPSDVPADYVEQDLTAPERRHRGVFALMHDNLWIYGGMHAECSDHLDDTWRFPLDGAGDWSELIEARTGESCLRQDADCDCLCY